MRRHRLLAAALFAIAANVPGLARPAVAQDAQPPHAWLFGEWTGGLFPVAPGLTGQACMAQPVVIFTRDVVLRATLTSLNFVQREIESVRATTQGAEFRFRPPAETAAPDLAGLPASGPAAGFGCADPDTLHVLRHGPNEISFPGCADFPEPLRRCPAR